MQRDYVDDLIYEHIFLGGDETEEDFPGPDEEEPGDDLPPWVFPIDDQMRKSPGSEKKEVGRTVARQGCVVDAHFGIVLKNQQGREVGRVRVSQVQPEVRVLSQGSLEARISVTRVADVPGTLKVEVTRDAPGAAAPPTRELQGDSSDALTEAARQQDPIPIPAPPNMNGGNNRVVVEELTATVTWTTAAGKECKLTEKLRVRWEFANRRSRFRWWPPSSVVSGNSRTRVSHGRSLKRFRDGNGQIIFAVPVQTFYPVENPGACCENAGGYAVIQFVRHEWNILEQPKQEGGDGWSLDVLDSEINRANANPPETYDPTFTHNPRGTSPDSEPLVYPGPDPDGEQAISQFDRPGIPPALHQRLIRANPGTEFLFHFMSFLVCSRDPSDATGYLANGKVAARIEYKLRVTFRGRDREPDVAIEPVSHDVYSPCKTLGELLQTLDRQRRRRRQGSLASGYASPRGHRVAIPSGN